MGGNRVADNFSTATQLACYMPFTYNQTWWGELIYGTKQELQALGLAPGLPFPGEMGGPARTLKVVDPRGLPCKIEQPRISDGVYSASILYPNRDGMQAVFATAYPGVTVEHLPYADLYRGRAAAVIAAGLVGADQLPGAPGLRKTSAYFYADGAVMAGRQLDQMPEGAKHVRRQGKYQVNVYVFTSPEVAELRGYRGRIEAEEFMRRMLALPRFPPLVPPDRDATARARRAQMRLVWSKPVAIPILILPPLKV